MQRAFPVRELAVDTATINVEMDPEDEFRVRSAIAADHGMQCAARARAAARARRAAARSPARGGAGCGCPRTAGGRSGGAGGAVLACGTRPMHAGADPDVIHTLALPSFFH